MRLLACLVFAISIQAAADSPAVYESLDDIPIGTVFVTPETRRELDRRRWSAPVSRGEPATNAGTETSRPDSGFGFIILDDGTSTRWIDGEFRATGQGDTDDSAMRPYGITNRMTIRAHGIAEEGDNNDDD
ncbi:MAG: hypothetical protein RLN69_16530, partial [Woeseiaceae bacterium]